MARQSPPERWNRGWVWFLAATGLVGAAAALTLPGPVERWGANTSEIATVLGVGALAMLAGHTWGILVLATADVVLVGTVWPMVFLPGGISSGAFAAAMLALLAALPGLVVIGHAIPGTFDLLVGGQAGRLRTAGVACCNLLLALWLLLPVL